MSAWHRPLAASRSFVSVGIVGDVRTCSILFRFIHTNRWKQGLEKVDPTYPRKNRIWDQKQVNAERVKKNGTWLQEK